MALIRMHHHEIVHIPYVPTFALSALHPLIKGVHIDVGEELAGQIADRQTFARPPRLTVAANDIFDDSHQPAISYPLTQ